MKSSNFLLQTRKTWNYKLDTKDQTVNAVLGMVGEMGELEEANGSEEVLAECGDLLYYIARVTDVLGLTYTEHPVQQFDGMHMGTAVCAIAERVKKRLYHKRTTPDEELQAFIDHALAEVNMFLKSIGRTREEAQQYCVEKLQKRYPQGFEDGGGVR